MTENQEAAVRVVEAAQVPRELSTIYRWVTRDVLGTPPILSQGYLDEMKLSRVIFGGGDLERRYQVEAARPGGRVCYLNLDYPIVPNWLWVNEVMFTEFGVRVPFSDFRQRLLNLLTESLELPQDPKVFLYLFTFFSLNTEGKTKKGYMSVRPGKYRKIFGLYEDSFHDFKGHFFKIFPVGEHFPFWLSLEGQGRFPPYLSQDASMDYVPVTYKGLNVDQKDTADILVKLFFDLKPKTVLSNPSEARKAILGMAGNEVTLERLRRLIRPGSSRSMPAVSVPAPGASKHPTDPQLASASGTPVFPEGVARPCLGKRLADDTSAYPKRPRVSVGTIREFCSMDHSFDASSFIENNLLGPRAQEPRLTAADQWEGRCVKLNGDLKALNLQMVEAEKEKLAAEQAKVKAESDLKSLPGKLEALRKERDQETERRKDREAELGREIQDLRNLVSDEKARADKAEASLVELEKDREELVQMAEDSVVATERALKAQVSLLLSNFDVSQLGAFEVIVDGKIVDLPE
ncbi:hypothetical protein PIB30_069952 [Stylosanthes scabra]|uniref:Uncharacterized protein n=1 Tax=Stylosanthes scabra TaxID=79078 RepID=A0ABU6ZM54_9FABA|nr:hypothetical protein [Stylosanthes scabra]